MSGPLVSIIIPAKNAQATIKKCIGSIVQQSYKNYELIVVNDGSTDKTTQILTDYPQAKALTTPGTGPSKARNMAIKQAKGEFVAFTDADCVVDYHWIEELLRGFINEQISGVGGTQRSPEDDSWFGKKVQDFLSIFGFISGYMKSGPKMRLTNHNPSCNVMYRKSILVESGGFLEGLWPGEDVELDYRIKKKGYLLMFNPKAIVYHYRPPDWRAFGKMMFRYGWAQGYLVKKYGIFRIIHFVPLLIFILALTFLYNFFWGLLLFTLISIPIIIKLLRSKNPFLMFQISLANIFSWLVGFCFGFFKKR